MVQRLPRKDKGFSLLETIIAIGILSVGIITVLEAFSFSARVTGLSADMVSAVFISEDKLQELEYKEAKGKIKDEPDSASGQTGKFSWEYSLSLDTALDLYKLDYRITWVKAGREEQISINTYLR